MHARHLVRRVANCLAGLAIVTVAAVAVATVSGGPVLAREAALDDPIVKLTALLRRVRDQPTLLEGRNLSAARSLLVDVRLLWSIEPSRAQDAALVMLDVMGQYLDASNEPTSKTPESELRDAARSALEAHLDPAFGRWLALEILAQDHAQPIERRLAVARLFETNNVPASKLVLLACAGERDPRLRRSARRALSGWSDEAVHALFFAELGGSGERRDLEAETLAEQHFERVRFAPDSRIAGPYAQWVRAALVSPDWRQASRAARLQAPIDNDHVVPALIEALAAWKSRAEAGAQSLRVRHEIRRALRERSGRSFSMDPKEWREWWALVRAGKVRGLTPQTAGGFQESTEASFFGIRPMSDRLVFVIDRSGSMQEPFRGRERESTGGSFVATESNRRFDEATRQLLGFLEAMGPSTRFDVVLFHDLAEPWRGELVPATPANLAAMREWLTFQKPNGGTMLRSGVDAALHVGRDGRIDLAKLEADTVIVLCDGETAEGPAWVEPFLERVVPWTRVVFHGVQIGSEGDATMSRLAAGSHGDFVKMDG